MLCFLAVAGDSEALSPKLPNPVSITPVDSVCIEQPATAALLTSGRGCGRGPCGRGVAMGFGAGRVVSAHSGPRQA